MAGLWAATLAACQPALNWRDFRPAEGDGLRMLMPCKPARQERRLTLADQPVRFVLYACEAGGATWSVATAELDSPYRVAKALAELRAAAARNLGVAAPPAGQDWPVPGATPQPGAQRLGWAGQRPDGQPLRQALGVFSFGTRVYQVSCLGPVPAAAQATFFDAVRFEH